MASAETFPVRKYVNGTIAIVSNHTQIMASRAAFRGDVWLSRLDDGKGGYLMDTIKNISKNTHKLNNTLISIKAQLLPVGCVANNTKSALFNFTTNEYFNCTCKTGWVGEDCAAPQNPIPNANWKAFVDACLGEVGAEANGECTSWASGNDYGTMPNWDVSLVTDMAQSFMDKSNFTGDITKWDTSQVTNMREIFRSASAFNQNIGNWNTAQVTDMGAMFYYASAFNQNISSWTGTAATTAQGSMFSGATAFQNKFTCTNAITGPASSCVAFTASPPPPTSPLACAFSYKPGESGCNAGNINNGDGMCECCVYTPWSWRSCSNDCGCACDASETYSAGIGKCI